MAALVVLAVTADRKVPSRTPPASIPVVQDSWAGYVSSGPNLSAIAVEASWVVPSVVDTCPASEDEQAFTWVGIGGWDTDSSIGQLGLDVACSYGVPQYSTWYEFWPSPSVSIPTIQLSPGDTVFATASYSNGSFELVIQDVTTNVTFYATAPDGAANRTTVEWIEEAPVEQPYSAGIRFPLTDFGVVTFSNTSVNRGSGFVSALSAGNLTETYFPSTGSSGGATPGPLQISGFDVNWTTPR